MPARTATYDPAARESPPALTPARPTASASAAVRSVVSRPGRPLREADRVAMGRRLGTDVSAARLHTGPEAAASAERLGADAYAVGRHVVLGAGRDERTHPWLVGHELAHVVQQRFAEVPPTGDLAVTPAGSAAEAAADAAVRDGAAPAPAFHRPVVQRQPAGTAPAAATEPTPTVSGPSELASPTDGVALRNGTLTWRLRYVGRPPRAATSSGTTITIPISHDVQMDATFTPTAGSGCPRVAFVQSVRPTTGGVFDAAKLLYTRDPASNASADVTATDTSPFYGVAGRPGGPAGLVSGMPGSVQIGSATGATATPATFADAPTWAWDRIPPGQTAVREFELAVVCVETGESFGSLRWGYTKTRGAVITLTGARQADVRATGASAEVEQVRQAYYRGFFAHSLNDFGRGSATLTRAHRTAIATIAATPNVRRIVLVGANDFSGGPEDNAALSVRRAEAVRDALVRLGVPTGNIVVEGHGVEAREPNPRGRRVAANRRVDVHLDRGIVGGTRGAEGSAREASRLRRQDPRFSVEELVDLLMQLQAVRGRIPRRSCDQLIHILDGIRRWQRFDPTVPDVDAVYGPVIRALLNRCESLVPRADVHIPPRPLEPPSFLPRIREDATGL